MKLKIDKIKVNPDRQRKSMSQGGLDALAVSMAKHGQLHPLIVVREPDESGCNCGKPNTGSSNPHDNSCDGTYYQLVSGERRLNAAKINNWVRIEVTEKPNANKLQLEEIELDENLCRENLSWQEEVAAKKRVWEVRAELYGETVEEVAAHVGASRGGFWEDASLASAIEIVPELANSKNKTQAMNKLRLLKRRAALTELSSRDSVVASGSTDYSGRVKLGDCVAGLKEVGDEVISLVLTDPPYGIDLDKGETKKGSAHPTIYADDHYDIMEVVELAAKEAFRVLKPDSHAYFWFDIKAYQRVFEFLSSLGFKVDPVPLLWVKNTPGQVNHPESRWASGYEACFFCRKGNRALLKQGASNVLKFDAVPPSKKIHPVEKPTALLRQLIEASTVPGEVVLDMFGGSGSTAEAAIQTGRNFLLYEKDPAFHAGILDRLARIGEQESISASGRDEESDHSEVEETGDDDYESDIEAEFEMIF